AAVQADAHQARASRTHLPHELPRAAQGRLASSNRAQAQSERRAPNSSTRPTTASIESPVESITSASEAGFRGATARVESLRSRSAMSRERAARLTSDPLSFNCL